MVSGSYPLKLGTLLACAFSPQPCMLPLHKMKNQSKTNPRKAMPPSRLLLLLLRESFPGFPFMSQPSTSLLPRPPNPGLLMTVLSPQSVLSMFYGLAPQQCFTLTIFISYYTTTFPALMSAMSPCFSVRHAFLISRSICCTHCPLRVLAHCCGLDWV